MLIALTLSLLMLQGYLIPFNPPVASGATCSSIATGNILSETFDATGYDNGLGPIWVETDVDGGGGSFDPDDITDPPLDGNCFDTKQLKITTAQDDRYYIQADWGAAQTEVWIRVYFATDALGDIDLGGENQYVVMVKDSGHVGNNTICHGGSVSWTELSALVLIQEHNTPSNGSFRFDLYSSSSLLDSSANISNSVDELFRIEIHLNNTTNVVGWKIHNMTTDTEIANDDTNVGTIDDTLEGICLGASKASAVAAAGNWYFDHLDIDSTGWLGE